MQITIEGTVKEVAALVLELQERRRNESEVSNTYACNLVVKDDDISNIDIPIRKWPCGKLRMGTERGNGRFFRYPVSKTYGSVQKR